MKTRVTRESESLASRSAILVIEVIGYLLVFRSSTGFGVLGTRFIPRSFDHREPWRNSHLVGHRAGDLGPLSPGRILERQGHDQGRPSAHPYRALFSPAPPHLHRPDSGDHWFGPGDRQVAMHPGTLPGGGWVLFQSKDRRNNAHPAIRRSIPGTSETHGFPDPPFSLKGSSES